MFWTLSIYFNKATSFGKIWQHLLRYRITLICFGGLDGVLDDQCEADMGRTGKWKRCKEKTSSWTPKKQTDEWLQIFHTGLRNKLHFCDTGANRFLTELLLPSSFFLSRTISVGAVPSWRGCRDGGKSRRIGQLWVWCGLQCCSYAQVG